MERRQFSEKSSAPGGEMRIMRSAAGADKVAEAWAHSVNAAGGLHGHKIRLYVEDDSTQQATAIQEVRALVEQGHVVAIVGQVSTWMGM
jgi:branched-chain amino acid transport system substrate-binding protein